VVVHHAGARCSPGVLASPGFRVSQSWGRCCHQPSSHGLPRHGLPATHVTVRSGLALPPALRSVPRTRDGAPALTGATTLLRFATSSLPSWVRSPPVPGSWVHLEACTTSPWHRGPSSGREAPCRSPARRKFRCRRRALRVPPPANSRRVVTARRHGGQRAGGPSHSQIPLLPRVVTCDRPGFGHTRFAARCPQGRTHTVPADRGAGPESARALDRKRPRAGGSRVT
jgi:hypothetical protein